MRVDSSVRLEMTLTERKRIAAETRPMMPRVRREGEVIDTSSIRLGEIDNDGVEKEEQRHHRDEEYRVAQIDDAAQDRIEVAVEAEIGDRLLETGGRPILQEAEHHSRAADSEEETHGRSQHEGNDLVLRER